MKTAEESAMISFFPAKKSMAMLAVLAFSLGAGAARAAEKAAGPVGYELIEESQDAATKSYTVTFEVWSADRDATELSVTPKTEGEGLEIVTRNKTWKGRIRRNRHFRYSITAKNPTTETKTLQIEVSRKAEKRTDSKTISVLVAPQ